jgi:DNA-directed RNA polymerase subunit RPC12/RpoP
MGILPSIFDEVSHTKITLPSGKKIGVKPWRVKEEKELLFATEGIESQSDIKKEIVKFLGKCVDNTSMYSELSEFDIIKIALEARKLSKSDTIEYNYKCTECGLVLEDKLQISKNAEIKSFDSTPYKVNDNCTVTFREPSFDAVEKIIEEADGLLTKYNYLYLIASLESATIRGETFTEFSKEDAIDFFDTFDSETFDAIVTALENKASSVKLKKKLKCIKCKKEIDVNFGDMLDFLAF